jgi:DNA polymerase III alpha subunit (gram-positive type)
MKSSITNFVVFDLETTGLYKDKNSILEIACCGFDFNLNDVKEFDSGVMQIYDNREVSPQALQANNITMDQIENGRDPKTVLDELIKYLESMKVGRNKPVLCGHNIDKFDIPFLDNFFSTFSKDLAKYVNEDFTIDTMWWSRAKWEEQTNFKLGTCCEISGIELVNAHRAIHDTRANKELVKSFLRGLRSNSSGSESKEKRYRETFQF